MATCLQLPTKKASALRRSLLTLGLLGCAAGQDIAARNGLLYPAGAFETMETLHETAVIFC